MYAALTVRMTVVRVRIGVFHRMTMRTHSHV
jgi:hypothetical protein